MLPCANLRKCRQSLRGPKVKATAAIGLLVTWRGTPRAQSVQQLPSASGLCVSDRPGALTIAASPQARKLYEGLAVDNVYQACASPAARAGGCAPHRDPCPRATMCHVIVGIVPKLEPGRAMGRCLGTQAAWMGGESWASPPSRLPQRASCHARGCQGRVAAVQGGRPPLAFNNRACPHDESGIPRVGIALITALCGCVHVCQ